MNSSAGKPLFDVLQLSSMLQEGSAAVFPTDTLPALASIPDHAAQLWKMKRRPANKPLILMGASPRELFQFVSSNCLEDAEMLASQFWPGPLTMVLPASGSIVDALNPGGVNIGVRIPASDVAIELLSKCGPLATTSANLAGCSPAMNAEEVVSYFPGLPLLAPLPWPIASGLASTVILWRSQGSWQVVRKGAVIIQEV